MYKKRKEANLILFFKISYEARNTVISAFNVFSYHLISKKHSSNTDIHHFSTGNGTKWAVISTFHN